MQEHIVSLKKPPVLPRDISIRRSIETVSPPPKRRTRLYTIIAVAFLLAVTGLFLGGYIYLTHEREARALAEVESIVATVGTHIILPVGEGPVAARVSDPAQLPREPFFLSAQTGDIVLFYPASKKAYLYRPSAEKLVEVAVITTAP